MFKKVFLLAGIAFALAPIVSADIPIPPCDPCMVSSSSSPANSRLLDRAGARLYFGPCISFLSSNRILLVAQIVALVALFARMSWDGLYKIYITTLGTCRWNCCSC